jgi:hypothetical protein
MGGGAFFYRRYFYKNRLADFYKNNKDINFCRCAFSFLFIFFLKIAVLCRVLSFFSFFFSLFVILLFLFIWVHSFFFIIILFGFFGIFYFSPLEACFHLK